MPDSTSSGVPRIGRSLRRHPTQVGWLNVGIWSVQALIVLLVIIGAFTGCAPASRSAAQRIGSSSTDTVASSSDSGSALPSDAASTPISADLPVTAALAGPAVVDTTGGITINADGAVLPDPSRTPGGINAAVTQANIASTICTAGWTSTVRPDSTLTTALKKQQLASGYAYHGDTATADYEEDHLISLELGGAPNAAINLWPEPYNTPDGARVKDVIENKLNKLICTGSLSLATAQHAIASNWWIAYQTYVGTAPAPITGTPAPAITQAPPPASLPSPGNGATALCNDGTYSFAAHHQGACSRHGGVKIFYK